jgi:hypothetical protein
LEYFASVALGVSAFELPGIYLFNRSRVTEYLPSISDTRGNIIFMERAPPNMTVVCVTNTAATNSQNVLLSSAELSVSIDSSILPFDASPEEITSSRLLKMINPVPQIPRKYSTEKIATLFFYY